MDEENKENCMSLIEVKFDNNTNQYSVSLGKGSNVAETAFAVSVIIKCLVKDNVIKDSKEFTDLLNKYLTDPQYDEIK